MGFIVTPLTFVLIFSLLTATAAAFAGDILGIAGMAFLPGAPVMSDELGNIFEPSTNESESIPLADVEFPSYETVYGRIEIASAGIDCPLIYGDSYKALRSGAGQYIGSFIIGYGGTTLIAGHNYSCFEKLPQVKKGDVIKITTSYGVYRYDVVDIAVKMDNDSSAYDLGRKDENVILYTCFTEKTPVGNVKKRIYIYGDYLSGPMLDKG